MEKNSYSLPEKEKETIQEKADKLVDKAEAFIDDAAEKIHKSGTYQKTGQSMEKTTKFIFRKAGRWWGKLGK